MDLGVCVDVIEESKIFYCCCKSNPGSFSPSTCRRADRENGFPTGAVPRRLTGLPQPHSFVMKFVNLVLTLLNCSVYFPHNLHTKSAPALSSVCVTDGTFPPINMYKYFTF